MFSNPNSGHAKSFRALSASALVLLLLACQTVLDEPPIVETSAVPPPPLPPPPPPRPSATLSDDEFMFVIRGSDMALAFYPKGRKVVLDARICLPEGDEFLTFQRSDGGTVTYGGGGCNKLADDPTTETDESIGAHDAP